MEFNIYLMGDNLSSNQILRARDQTTLMTIDNIAYYPRHHLQCRCPQMLNEVTQPVTIVKL